MVADAVIRATVPVTRAGSASRRKDLHPFEGSGGDSLTGGNDSRARPNIADGPGRSFSAEYHHLVCGAVVDRAGVIARRGTVLGPCAGCQSVGVGQNKDVIVGESLGEGTIAAEDR